jgi:hypothetical protein
MKLDAPSGADVRHVAERIRERDAVEFLAVSHSADKAELVEALVQRYGGAPDAICAYRNGEPVAVGAMVQVRPNVVTLAFFATDRFPEVALELTKFIRNRLFPQYRADGVHRIECISMVGYDDAHRWIGLLGLEQEAVLPKYGKGGETYILFSWVEDESPTGL